MSAEGWNATADVFNELARAYIAGELDGGAFRIALMDRLGYDYSEARSISRRLEGERDVTSQRTHPHDNAFQGNIMPHLGRNIPVGSGCYQRLTAPLPV
jgi:hypothetical protein